MQRFFQYFESRVDPYPDSYDYEKSKNIWQFVWACTNGSRFWLLGLTLLTGLLGAFEAIMYAWMGWVVDWIGQYGVAQFWQEKSTIMIFMLGALIASMVVAILNAGIHFQSLQGIFPYAFALAISSAHS